MQTADFINNAYWKYSAFFLLQKLQEFYQWKVQGQITEIFMGWFPGLFLQNLSFFSTIHQIQTYQEKGTCQLPRYIQTVASCLRPGLFVERPVLFIYPCTDVFRSSSDTSRKIHICPISPPSTSSNIYMPEILTTVFLLVNAQHVCNQHQDFQTITRFLIQTYNL